MKILHITLLLSLTFCLISTKISNRIIGGTPALPAQFPFAAAIYVQKSDGHYFCGGTLIAKQWVLTSGHCAEKAVLFTIQLGSNGLSTSDPNRVVLSTSDFLLHPEFDPVTLQNDIALIKTRLPVEYTNYVRQVRFLPTFRLPDGTATVAIGWGQIDDQHSELSEQLEAVDLVSISTEDCRLFYGNQITDDMVCVSGNYNEGSCTGDIGSPLLQHVGRGYYLIAGVASFISGHGCESTDPSGYTRTFSYIDWIKNVTAE